MYRSALLSTGRELAADILDRFLPEAQGNKHERVSGLVMCECNEALSHD